MKQKAKLLTSLAGFAVLGAAVLAMTSTRAEQGEPAAAGETPLSTAVGTGAAASSPAAKPAPTFKPSTEIPVDQAVDFPVDI